MGGTLSLAVVGGVARTSDGNKVCWRILELKLLRFFPLAIVVSIGPSVAADVYKCVSKDKKVIFTDTPCDGARSAKPVVPQVPSTKHFSRHQVNMSFDCMEALDTLIFRDVNPEVFPESETTHLRKQFNELCPAVGFKTPEGRNTRGFNLDYAKRLKKSLEDNNYTGPTFTRSYEGGRRSPPVFSGF